MKTVIAILAIALGASIPIHGARAADQGHSQSLGTPSQSEDFSARKKKRVYVYGPSYGYYYQPRYRAFAAADPSWQSPELLRLRALNRCVFDLGYGRWQNCN